jgi:hypothetical protein
MTDGAMVGWRMTLDDDEPNEHREPPRDHTADYRRLKYVDPMERSRSGGKGMALEACFIGVVLIAVWIKAGIIVWRDLLA